MKQLLTIAVSLATVTVVAPRSPSANVRSSGPVDETYAGLRNLALTTTSKDLGLSPISPQEPYTVVMDMDMVRGTATVMSSATRAASLYLSTGGGFIGAGESSPAADGAAKEFVQLAATYIPQMKKSAAQPLPDADQVTFYVVTDSGVFTASAATQELGERKNALSPLFYAGQGVLAQIRLTAERQKAS
jgi:hypothetical protein